MIILNLIGGSIEQIKLDSITSVTLFVIAGLMIILFIHAKFFKKETPSEYQEDEAYSHLTKDILLQPIKKDGRASEQLPFTNYNYKRFYLWLFLILISFFLLLRKA